MKCKKVTYGNTADPHIIYGVIVKEIEGFIVFKTAKKEYKISKNAIISIEDSDREFFDYRGGD